MKISHFYLVFFALPLFSVGCIAPYSYTFVGSMKVGDPQDFFIAQIDSSQWKRFNETLVFVSLGSQFRHMICWPDGRLFHSSGMAIRDLTPENVYLNTSGSAGYYQIVGNELYTETAFSTMYMLHDVYEILPDSSLRWTHQMTVHRADKSRLNKMPPIIYSLYREKPADTLELWEPFW